MVFHILSKKVYVIIFCFMEKVYFLYLFILTIRLYYFIVTFIRIYLHMPHPFSILELSLNDIYFNDFVLHHKCSIIKEVEKTDF